MYDIVKYQKLIRARLNEKRYQHSLNVAQEARRLAVRYGEDVEKAYVAGLLHDVMKNLDEVALLHIVSKADIIKESIELYEPNLWHQIAGAYFVRDTLHITDPDIFNAIRYHTTGRESMSRLEKVIYLADLISADRNYHDVERVREIAYQSLDAGVFEGLRFTIKDVSAKGKPIPQCTFRAYNELSIQLHRKDASMEVKKG